MLRREKKEVFQAAGDGRAGGAAEGAAAAAAGGPATSGEAAAAVAAAGGGGGGGAKPAAMPHKNDLIVWLKLQPMQRKVYQAFLNAGGWCWWKVWWVGWLAHCHPPCLCMLLHSPQCQLDWTALLMCLPAFPHLPTNLPHHLQTR